MPFIELNKETEQRAGKNYVIFFFGQQKNDYIFGGQKRLVNGPKYV